MGTFVVLTLAPKTPNCGWGAKPQVMSQSSLLKIIQTTCSEVRLITLSHLKVKEGVGDRYGYRTPCNLELGTYIMYKHVSYEIAEVILSPSNF